ncbi:alpha/beta hydrolase [Nonomuraea fuscirosea]|uniref:hypothetical protein n=1 Tax=Nonomuraea fuscirosea TaxID=1291556 RepID=UPI002DD9050E|nr:hypothetical protein [Nonomuraea fuscirosea]WSA48312.1 alpha/beta hydrolase [Nonomuraea fuscirosea]
MNFGAYPEDDTALAMVGWFYGGVLGRHWADRNPDRLAGLVTVGAFPVSLTGEAGAERIRKLLRRMRLFIPIAARLGLAARMSADEHPEVTSSSTRSPPPACRSSNG